MSYDPILESVNRYYSDKIQAEGATPAGVDWNSAESQRLRFAQLLEVCDRGVPFSLNDYGCGYGALADYLQETTVSFHYSGFDISSPMIAKARQLHAGMNQVAFFDKQSDLGPADYTVASGIFNVKLHAPEDAWQRHVLDTLKAIDALSMKGFAFNVLTKYSDPELMRRDLYYADPLFLFDYCKTAFSRFVSLLHDYPLYEFTILVRKG